MHEGARLPPSKYSSTWHHVISMLLLYSFKEATTSNVRNAHRVSGRVILCWFEFSGSSLLRSVAANQTAQKVNPVNCECCLSSILFIGE